MSIPCRLFQAAILKESGRAASRQLHADSRNCSKSAQLSSRHSFIHHKPKNDISSHNAPLLTILTHFCQQKSDGKMAVCWKVIHNQKPAVKIRMKLLCLTT